MPGACRLGWSDARFLRPESVHGIRRPPSATARLHSRHTLGHAVTWASNTHRSLPVSSSSGMTRPTGVLISSASSTRSGPAVAAYESPRVHWASAFRWRTTPSTAACGDDKPSGSRGA